MEALPMGSREALQPGAGPIIHRAAGEVAERLKVAVSKTVVV
jgi:hypothetical protein